MKGTCHPPPLCPSLSGYWQTWPLPETGALPLCGVPRGYGDVLIAFAAPDETGTLRLSGPVRPTREDVAALRRRGQRTLLSIGGGGVTVTLASREQAARFSESLYGWICALDVDGIDIDVELGMPATGAPDRLEGTAKGLALGVDAVLAALPPGFLLTFAPETVSLAGGMARYGGAWGNYLPLLLHFGDRVSRVHMQLYNSGPMPGLDGVVHQPGTVGFVVAMTEAAIQGFDIAGTGVRFPGLPPWKVGVGLPASPQAAANGYMSPEAIEMAFCLLRERYGGFPGCPNLGGLMTWSVQWDSLQQFSFMENALGILGW